MVTWKMHAGHCLQVLRSLPGESVQCCVTSPPYWGLRDYGDPGQGWSEVSYRPVEWAAQITIPAMVAPLGLEPNPQSFVGHLVAVFREVRRVLRADGTLWLNLGDKWNSTSGNRQVGINGSRLQATVRKLASDAPIAAMVSRKSLLGIPWAVAMALRADGWVLRSDSVWHKLSRVPDPVRDRPERAHEHVFLFSRSDRYEYEQTGLTDVWSLPSYPDPVGHDASMNRAVPERCILAGCPPGGIVLDPFAGSATVGAVALAMGRSFVGIELSPEYMRKAEQRLTAAAERAGLLDAEQSESIDRVVQLGLFASV